MSFAYLSQYDEAFPCKNSDESVYPKEQSFDVELKKSTRKENFWHLLRKKIASVLSLLQNRSPRSPGSNLFQQTSEVLALSSPVESCPDMSLIAAFSSAYCSCIPVGSVPPPTKIMVCLPCPPPASPATFDFVNKRCESYPFCVPRKLDECHAQASRKGKYLPPPERRRCSERCLHVSDLKAARPCMAVQGSPCVAHCYETHRKCSST